MKKTILFATCALAVILLSCEKDDRDKLEKQYEQALNEQTAHYQYPKAKFSYEIISPLNISFSNSSSNSYSFKWNFGDGKTSTSTNPTHKYSGTGIYKVTLYAYNQSLIDSVSQNIEIHAPTKCYLSKVSFDQLSLDNKEFRVQLTDDGVFYDTKIASSNWYLLSNTILPYTITWKTHVQLNNFANEGHYLMKLFYRNPDTSSEGTLLKKMYLYSSDLKKYPLSIKLKSDNNQLTAYFDWE